MSSTQHRSVSQVKTYDQCGYRYYLERHARAWQRPAAWFPHGTAVHEAAEAYERSNRTLTPAETLDVFSASYANEVNRYAAETPNLEYWQSSGRYRGEDDVTRRYSIGREQTLSYIDYYETHQHEVVWIADDGTPGIELEFNVHIGGVPMRGYIDLLMPDRIRDTKTGSTPGDPFQLATYAMAAEAVYGKRWDIGDYWLAKKGKPSKPYAITAELRREAVARIQAADEGIRAERFDPKPGENCRRCSVASSCEFAEL